MSGVELVGLIASGFALLEVLTKLAKFAGKVKSAEEQFRRYMTDLQQLQSVSF